MDASTSPVQTGEATRTERHLRLLVETGLLLASERSLDAIVQAALEAGLELSGASFGAFFYSNRGADGESYGQFRVAGKQAAELASAALLRSVASMAPSFAGAAVRRMDDVVADRDLAHHPALAALQKSGLAVRSLLTVPVRSRSGETMGAMLYTHPEPAQFATDVGDLVATVASQAAVAMDNSRLAANVQREIAVADNARQLQRATSDRLEQVLESTSDGVALLDRNWRFTYINGYANGLVAPGRNLLGTGFWDLFPEDRGGVFEQHYRRAMDDGEPTDFTEFYAPLGIWAYIRVFPTPEGIAIFFQDVTKEKRAEQEREETTQRLRQALDAGALGTWTWDAKTDLLDFDERAAELFGIRAHEAITRSELRQRVVHREDLASTPVSLRGVMTSTNSAPYAVEYRITLPNGVTRWIASTGIERHDGATGKVVGMSGTVQDVTTRKTQEATLRQSEKLAATGRLAATIAHEINNPLEAVTNLIFLCKTDPEAPTHVQRLLETADGELARVAQIAQQTLGFYRDTTRPTEIDVAGLLSSVVDLFSRKLLAKKVACTLDVARDLRIIGLAGEIKQVFSNLLVNAIDASDANTTIRIRGKSAAHEGRRGVSVLLADEGAGIPEHVRERLFSPFFTTKESVGTGLGLWVTRGIVEKQGGLIRFRSCTDSPTGTVFRVFLPAETRNPESFDSPQPKFLQ